MSPEKLTYMANQIAMALRSRPHDEAVAGVAEHISNFWEPRMRAQLLALIDEEPLRFDALVRQARDRIKPVHV
jgi:formate dehydrogenase subunit delta